MNGREEDSESDDSISTVDVATIQKFLEEGDILYAMREINHPHLLRAIAAFERGDQSGIIMPRARGSLRLFCETQDNSMYQSETMLPWVFAQLLGLTDGLARLHGHYHDFEPSICHGVLTPDKILWFPGHDSEPDGHSLGVLVIGDLGRRKQLGNDDREHSGAELRYAARDDPPSPSDDTWSLGLIFFEFVIWLIRGRADIQEFRSQTSRVGASDEDDYKFQEWLILLMDDDRCLPGTPLGVLVQFIVRRLLVPRGGPREEGRATASRFFSWIFLVRFVVGKSGYPYTAVQRDLPSLLSAY